MKTNKILAAAGALTVSAMTMSVLASAAIAVPETKGPGLDAGSGTWKILILGDGVDQGVDLESIAKFTVRFTTDDTDWFEGQFGGSLFTTCDQHNWEQKNWWGVVDDELEINTQNPEEALLATKVGDYTYELSLDIDETNCLYADSTYAGAGMQEWGSDMSQLVVLSATFYDASGNVVIAYDGNGNVTSSGSAAPAAEEAPAATEAAAPAAGDVTAATASSTKGSPDTGVEDVAAFAGLAIVAAGAVLVSKKRK
ncbi:MAG: LPXTG cell wall anchor domain-containing protein [Bacteroides sp.]|nr:LPXTG cell wall anchor domain-containing protein [Eubacterium sp.]MCM1419043.1 LPXTG cell wall anchor domain-containing protein [Roseburia sp.]MCM1463614.1 LPXTG cell wall anchor domain-containing protein [Bacteroides sp.]